MWPPVYAIVIMVPVPCLDLSNRKRKNRELRRAYRYQHTEVIKAYQKAEAYRGGP